MASRYGNYQWTSALIICHLHFRIRTNNLANNSVTILETMVNSFTNGDELMNFAATWGWQDSLAVRYKLFQINTQYDETFEQLESLLQTLRDETDQTVNVRMDDEILESINALLFDEEMEDLRQTCLDDGEWNPMTQVRLIFTLSTFINVAELIS